MDVFSNSVTGLEAQNSKTACTVWELQTGQSRYTLENFYAYSPIGARIVDKEPSDALRKGYTIDSEEIDEQQQRDIADWNRRRQFLSKFAQARKWERLFGGALIFMGIDDGRNADEPVDMANIHAVGQLTVLSRYDVTISEYANDPATGELAQPAYYDLVQGGGRIHPSRVIRFGGIPLTIEQMVNNQGWGAGVIDRVWLELERYTTTQSYLAEAITRITQGVFTTPTLSNASSADCTQEQLLEDRLTALGQWMGMLGDIVVGEDESYNVIQRGLQGFRDAAEIFVDAVTAATDIPKSILFGITVGGLNSGDNAGDWQSWTSHLGGVQTEIYDPRVGQYQTIVFAAGNSPLPFVPEQWAVSWPALYQASELDSSTALVNTSNAAVALSSQGLITEREARSNEAIQAAFPAQDDTVTEEENELAFGENSEAQILQAAQQGGELGERVENLQQTALNGAQITALLEIVGQVSAGTLAPEAGTQAIRLGFPQIPEDDVRALISAAQKSRGAPELELVSD
jgi:phage-related protein (TIGR01555 family)